MRPIAAASLLAFLTGCAHSPAGALASADAVAAARAGITAQHEAWREAIIGGDSPRLANLFTEDGMVLGLDGSVAKGRPELQKLFADFLKTTKYLSGGITIEALDLQGELAIEIAAFGWDRSLAGGAPTGVQKGHALAVWQHLADGPWLLRAWSAKYDPPPRQ